MKDIRGLFIVSLALGLGFALPSKANTIPTINIDDTTGPIMVSPSGSSSLTIKSGTIGGNSEAIWFCATGANFGFGYKGGIWTDPGSSKISDEFYVVAMGSVAYGFFLSDPAVVPTKFNIPIGGGLSMPIDLNALGLTTSTETGTPTDISPNPALFSVMATSSVPDGGNTLILLGLGMGGLVWFGWRRTRSGPKP